MLFEDFGGGLPVEDFAGPVVERVSDGLEVFGGPARQVCAFGEVLPQQSVDASMSSGLLASGDVVCPCRLVGVHGPVDDVYQVSLEDPTSTAGALG